MDEHEMVEELGRLGTLTADGRGASLILSEEETESCGLAGPEGSGGSPEEIDERRRMLDLVQQYATLTGLQVEVYGQAADASDWVVEVVEPEPEIFDLGDRL